MQVAQTRHTRSAQQALYLDCQPQTGSGCSMYKLGVCTSLPTILCPNSAALYSQHASPLWVCRMPIFLFNYNDKRMHGIFRAIMPGTQNINPQGTHIAAVSFDHGACPFESWVQIMYCIGQLQLLFSRVAASVVPLTLA